MLSSTADVLRQPWTIPTRWLNSAIALFLLPIALLLTETFFTAFSQTRAHQAFWITEEFWFFGLGAALWSLWFCGSIWALGEPRPSGVYVFGHELTHAIWVWLMGGRVREFRVSRDGGHILTDTHNFWIALAPYFYPIYSLAVIILYGFISLFYNLGTHRLAILWVSPSQWLFLALGGTWAFHLSFTCWMIPKGQSDLRRHGTFFSLVIIYIMNIALLSVFLVVAAREITWATFGADLLKNAAEFSASAWEIGERMAREC